MSMSFEHNAELAENTHKPCAGNLTALVFNRAPLTCTYHPTLPTTLPPTSTTSATLPISRLLLIIC